MAKAFGWAFISGSSVIGADNSVLVKTTGSQLSGSAELLWDSTNKKLTVSGSSSTVTIEPDKIEVSNITVSQNLTTTGEIAVGAEGRTLSSIGGLGNGNVMKISSVEVVPASYRGLVYGPLEVEDGSTLVIGQDAIIAVQPEAELPVDLRV